MSNQLNTDSGDNDEADILEIDGPPRGHFDIPVRGEALGLNRQGSHDIAFIECIVYQNFGLNGPTAKMMEDRRDAILGKVRAELAKYGGGIIWWRKRPELSNDRDEARYHLWMRFGTSPILPTSFWDEVSMTASDFRRTDFIPELAPL